MNKVQILSFLEQVVDYLLVRAGCFTLPTDLERVAEHLDVVEIQKKPIAAEGYVEQAEGHGYRVVLRLDRGLERQRFSLAHELGHIIVHRMTRSRDTMLSRQYRACTSVSSEVNEEAIADRIAGLLLLPPWSLNQRLPSDFSLKSIIGLASMAKASASTALIRAMWHTTVPCIGFQLKCYHERPQSLRCNWAVSSRSLPKISRERFLDVVGSEWVLQAMNQARRTGWFNSNEGHPAFTRIDLHHRFYFNRETVHGLAYLPNARNRNLFCSDSPAVDEMIEAARDEYAWDFEQSQLPV
jgi:hypothetical protein